MTIPVTEQLEALVDLDSEEYQLTAWEIDFIDSVEKQTRGGKVLSPKQGEIVSRIYDAVFIHGKRSHR